MFFNVKILQLYETVLVRHGLMMVGKTMGGKSSIVHTLARALELESKADLGEMIISIAFIAYTLFLSNFE